MAVVAGIADLIAGLGQPYALEGSLDLEGVLRQPEVGRPTVALGLGPGQDEPPDGDAPAPPREHPLHLLPMVEAGHGAGRRVAQLVHGTDGSEIPTHDEFTGSAEIGRLRLVRRIDLLKGSRINVRSGHDESFEWRAEKRREQEAAERQERKKEAAQGRGMSEGLAGRCRCADFLVRTDDEGGIGAAGKGSAEHGIHNLHLHFIGNSYGPACRRRPHVGKPQWHKNKATPGPGGAYTPERWNSGIVPASFDDSREEGVSEIPVDDRGSPLVPPEGADGRRA